MKRRITTACIALLVLAALPIMPASADDEEEELAPVAVSVGPEGTPMSCSVASFGQEIFPGSATYGAAGACEGVAMESIVAKLKKLDGVDLRKVHMCSGSGGTLGTAGPCTTPNDLVTGVYDAVGVVCFTDWYNVRHCPTSHYVFTVEGVASGAQGSDDDPS